MNYYRCRMCGTLWVLLPDGWSLVSPTCEKCCDNSDNFLSLMDLLSGIDVLTLLREGERFRAQLALYAKAEGRS